MNFTEVPDYRTAHCGHDRTEGCYHCCGDCNYVTHRCGGCGKPLDHKECGYSSLGTCNDCYKLYFVDK